MAHNPPNQEELDLRRRARRRLVGAIALALVAVVVLPMLFDPEPKPLGANVDIRVPGQDSPFEPVPASPSPALPQSIPEPVSVPPPDAPAAGQPPAAAQPAKLPKGAEKPQPAEVGAVTAPAKPKSEEGTKPEVKPKTATKSTTETKVLLKPGDDVKPPTGKPGPATPADKAYYLQLGSFSSETNARQLIEKAAVAGFKASAHAVNGQIKVRVGPLGERDKALDYQARLKGKGFDPVLVSP